MTDEQRAQELAEKFAHAADLAMAQIGKEPLTKYMVALLLPYVRDSARYQRTAFCIMWDDGTQSWYLTSNHVPGLLLAYPQLQDLLDRIIPTWTRLAELNGTEPPAIDRARSEGEG